MAKSIFICSKNPLSSSISLKLETICSELAPDNIIPEPPRILVNEKTAFSIMNPTDTICFKNNSLLMGLVYNTKNKWHIPLTDFPDGSYALFRNSDEYSEVISDMTASRTIWYYFDEHFFICTTSQRAIIMFLNSFEFNEMVIPWMLSTGSLGPEFSWDKRIQRIPPNSSIILNKKDWSINKKTNSIEFNAKKLTDGEHKKNLSHELQDTFNRLDLDFAKWYLPLSGGYDSRGILCFLSKKPDDLKNLNTVTWGKASAQKDIESDAYVAKKLSSCFRVTNTYYNTDFSSEPVKTIFDRFLKLGEGRIDHISGYMDGFKIWKTLYENGVQGVIRGDEGFGWNEVASNLYVRLSTGLGLCTDFANLKNYKKYGFAEQQIPNNLERKKEESLAQWRDRVYHQYRLSNIIASLTDLKLAYVEQISPFLSKNILEYVRQLPDHLRTNKTLFKEIVNDFNLDIKYATKDAITTPVDLLSRPETTKLLKEELSSEECGMIFPEEFLGLVLKNLNSKTIGHPGTIAKKDSKKATNLIPGVVKNFIRKYISKPKIDYHRIAFRIYIILKMHQNLSKDKAILKT